ncbi:hypothetical protein DERF_005962 [Dermatophagoides farinae]|uniref:Uncharacterized protein n=1 Tax=Dermatophagoides farinae TaxID=6954 RepID=A0A922L7P3_DERFA|nr:hypothetical protein DERF_005962 [Dermatophagoides farinae]
MMLFVIMLSIQQRSYDSVSMYRFYPNK